MVLPVLLGIFSLGMGNGFVEIGQTVNMPMSQAVVVSLI
jgi:hypothetical protein